MVELVIGLILLISDIYLLYICNPLFKICNVVEGKCLAFLFGVMITASLGSIYNGLLALGLIVGGRLNV